MACCFFCIIYVRFASVDKGIIFFKGSIFQLISILFETTI
jgi:hypothetical protein